jgi:hypothetical protein
VHDPVVVQVLQRQHRLREVHARHVHGQRAHVLEQRGTVAPCRWWTEHMGSAWAPAATRQATVPCHLYSVPSAPCIGVGRWRAALPCSFLQYTQLAANKCTLPSMGHCCQPHLPRTP